MCIVDVNAVFNDKCRKVKKKVIRKLIKNMQLLKEMKEKEPLIYDP